MTDNTKAEIAVAKIADRRDAATTKEFWGDLVRWYTNEQPAPVDRPLIEPEA